MKLKVLITGSSGFLGRHLYESLRRCDWVDTVLGIDKAPPSSGWEESIDITAPLAVENLLRHFTPHIAFHLSSPPAVSPLETLLSVNVVGTNVLLDAFARQDTSPLFLVAGSAAEYGCVMKDEIPVQESNLLRPFTDYGISKAAQTMLCLAKNRMKGIPVIICRLFNIIGPGMSSSLAFGSFVKQIADGERHEGAFQVKTGHLDGKRDFIDVRDVAGALCLLARAGKAGEIYNICSGVLHSIREGLDILLQRSSANMQVIKDQSRGSHFEPPDYSGDNSKIVRETGWHPTITFEQSMADLLDAARSEVGRGQGQRSNSRASEQHDK